MSFFIQWVRMPQHGDIEKKTKKYTVVIGLVMEEWGDSTLLQSG